MHTQGDKTPTQAVQVSIRGHVPSQDRARQKCVDHGPSPTLWQGPLPKELESMKSVPCKFDKSYTCCRMKTPHAEILLLPLVILARWDYDTLARDMPGENDLSRSDFVFLGQADNEGVASDAIVSSTWALKLDQRTDGATHALTTRSVCHQSNTLSVTVIAEPVLCQIRMQSCSQKGKVRPKSSSSR